MTPNKIYNKLLKTIKLFSNKNYEEYFTKKAIEDFNSLDIKNKDSVKKYILENNKLNDEIKRVSVIFGIYKN